MCSNSSNALYSGIISKTAVVLYRGKIMICKTSIFLNFRIIFICHTSIALHCGIIIIMCNTANVLYRDFR